MIFAHRPTSTLLLVSLGAGLALGVSCIPPPPMGLVVHGSQRKGTVIVSGQGGGGGSVYDFENDLATGAGGVVHVEPFVTERLSLPISVGGGRLWDSGVKNFLDESTAHTDWYGTLRIGARYRAKPYLTLGGGLGGGVRQGKDTFDGDRWHTTDGNATLDFEWSLGQRWRHVALSFTQRLVWDVRWVGVLHLLSDFTLAYFPAGKNFAFTASGFFGLSITTLWAGGCGGILLML